MSQTIRPDDVEMELEANSRYTARAIGVGPGAETITLDGEGPYILQEGYTIGLMNCELMLFRFLAPCDCIVNTFEVLRDGKPFHVSRNLGRQYVAGQTISMVAERSKFDDE